MFHYVLCMSILLKTHTQKWLACGAGTTSVLIMSKLTKMYKSNMYKLLYFIYLSKATQKNMHILKTDQSYDVRAALTQMMHLL